MERGAAETRELLVEFELGPPRAAEEVREHDWGRSLLCPALPLIWDANVALIERPGLDAGAVAAAAEEALSAFGHRTVIVADEAEGARLATEIGALPDWEAEVNSLLVWPQGATPPGPGDAAETTLAGCEGLRRELILSGFPAEMKDREETAEQLLGWGRRQARACGDRWFVAPPECPASACCLFQSDGIGQIEDVATLAEARGRGHARAAIHAALGASCAAGDKLAFIVADAEDWPRRLYARLGFVECGFLHVLRRPAPP